MGAAEFVIPWITLPPGSLGPNFWVPNSRIQLFAWETTAGKMQIHWQVTGQPPGTPTPRPPSGATRESLPCPDHNLLERFRMEITPLISSFTGKLHVEIRPTFVRDAVPGICSSQALIQDVEFFLPSSVLLRNLTIWGFFYFSFCPQ